MLQYNFRLKNIARRLRREMTESERVLWARLRKRQIRGVQFYRQKPIGDFVVDFYAPKGKLVVEVDGSQHLDADGAQNDVWRDGCLASQGLKVLRFSNLEVLCEAEAVLEVIFRELSEQVGGIPPDPLPIGSGWGTGAPL